MSSVFTLLFAPTFLILLQYFDFQKVISFFILLTVVLFIFTYKKTKFSKDLTVPTIYFFILLLAYYYGFSLVKFIPVFLSFIFFTIFMNSTINKKEYILNITRKFYPKDLSNQEILFLKNGDIYWVWVTGINTIIQFILVFYDNILWAFYSSVGWYIFFFISLVIQIIYGRFYAIRMFGK